MDSPSTNGMSADATQAIVLDTIAIDAGCWRRWSDRWGHADLARPAAVTASTERLVVSEWTDVGEGLWVLPGQDRYPDDTTGFLIDHTDNAVWLEDSPMVTAAAMLSGRVTQFWAQSYGGDPFAPGLFWWQADSFAQLGPDQPYASRYIHPYSGAVEIMLAHLHGFSEDELAEIHQQWRGTVVQTTG